MGSTNEIIKMINELSFGERLKIVEEILRGIRENNAFPPKEPFSKEPAILKLAGIFSVKEAAEFRQAIPETRKIDPNEW
ncbi:hypothetical protein [Pontibacter sp. G13]|uniref:hypothetical protein n=1 Tax=Pontibacter sp. G13 TaxID=3074898 RepID=UPI00288C292B|nr:hypothetical protein [Pontibacter sp. G13]WNJ16901.1 hypothetical protein RJD25_18715 [Pontibacter sp. G13]